MQKPTIVFAILLVAGVSANPGLFDSIGKITTGIISTAGKITTGVVTDARTIVQGTLDGVKQLVPGTGSIIDSVADTTGNLIAAVDNTIIDVTVGAEQFFAGVVSDLNTDIGNVGQVADNIIEATGNIIENVAENVVSNVTDGLEIIVDVASITTGVVTGAGTIVQGTLDGVEPLVPGTGSIIGGVANTTGNTINDVTVGAGQLFSGVVSDISTEIGNVGQMPDNIIETTGNIIGNVADNVVSGGTDGLENIVDVAGIISTADSITTGVVIGAETIVQRSLNGVEELVFGSGSGVGNTINDVTVGAGELFTGFVSDVNTDIGNIGQIADNLIGNLTDNVVSGVTDGLGNLSAKLLKAFNDAIQKTTDIGKEVSSTLDTFFQKSLGLFIDFLVKPALSEAKKAYAKVSAAVTKAISDANVLIKDLFSNFDDKIKEAVTLATNKVTDLAANLTKKLNESVASAVIIAECDTKLKLSLVEFAGNALSNISSCIVPSATFNVTDFADKAIEIIGGTSEQTKTIVASLQNCIDPVLVNLKDSAYKDTARTCLSGITGNSTKVQNELIALITKATTVLTSDLDGAAKEITTCLDTAAVKAEVVAKVIGVDLNTCLATTA